MKKFTYLLRKKTIILILLVVLPTCIFAQGNAKPSCEFWRKVQYGGAVGLNIGGGFTNALLAPSAKYNVDETISIGVGLQGSYVASNNNYSSLIYGGSIFALANLSDEIQLSADLDQLKVNTTYDSVFSIPSKHFWNTALFLGVGFRSENITVGAKYNVLFKKEDSVYSDAFMPFVRVYF